MKCRRKMEYEYLVLDKENAAECLEKMGYGEEYCKKTYKKDKRYGIVCDDRIKYGFENSMHGVIQFGKYVVFQADRDDLYEDVCSKEEFLENYITI